MSFCRRLLALGLAATLISACTVETSPPTGSATGLAGVSDVSADDLFDAYLARDRESIRAFEALEAPSVLDQLSHRVSRDQAIRQLLLELLQTPGADPDTAPLTWLRLVQRMNRIDQNNARWLKQVLEDLNWFTISQFGEEADNNAFLIVQHATHDPDFMRDIHTRFERLLAEGEVAADNYALLTDRLAVMDGSPQPYGSQFECVEGVQTLQTPLSDPEAVVDARRAEVGLPTLAAYRSLLPDCGSIPGVSNQHPDE